jgi:flagellar protein FliS
MFAATNASPRALHSLANAYQQIGLETATTNATPHKLIELLFEGFADAVARARGALLGRQIEAKGRAIGHAARIVEEGLKAALTKKDGGRTTAWRFTATRG